MSKRLLQLSVATLLTGFSASSFASGFQLFEVNGAGAGDFYAGGAASSNDASAAFFNPAALVTMKNTQIQLSGVNIFSNVRFQGSSTSAGLAPPATLNGSAEGGGYNLVPSLEIASPFNNEISWGFSITTPFGLNTDYGTSSFLRYAATKSKVENIDVSPSIGFKVTDKFSVGLGLDADRLEADLNSVVGTPLAPLDTQSQNNASGWGYGWHAGLLYQFTSATRLGFEYRSKVTYNVNGTSKLIGPIAGGFLSNDNLAANITLPATSILSFEHQFNNAFTGEATVAYTQWNVFDNLVLQNVQSAGTTVNVTIPQNFQNTWRVALGGMYQASDKWMLRGGVGYDQTPTVAGSRNVRLPDGNRFAAAVGVHYQATKAVGLDVGWTHLFFQNGDVSNVQSTGPLTVTTIGTAESYADVVGAQLTWDIV